MCKTICDAYRVRLKINSYSDIHTGFCIATRERDECYCNGDKTNCSFYPTKRETAIQEKDTTHTDTVTNLIEELVMGIETSCRVFRWDGSPEGYIKDDVDKLILYLKEKYGTIEGEK